jgi:hypothetical protein
MSGQESGVRSGRIDDIAIWAKHALILNSSETASHQSAKRLDPRKASGNAQFLPADRVVKFPASTVEALIRLLRIQLAIPIEFSLCRLNFETLRQAFV